MKVSLLETLHNKVPIIHSWGMPLIPSFYKLYGQHFQNKQLEKNHEVKNHTILKRIIVPTHPDLQ